MNEWFFVRAHPAAGGFCFEFLFPVRLPERRPDHAPLERTITLSINFYG
jgi:hypothetical protein